MALAESFRDPIFPNEPGETTDREGAQRIARQIEQYWAERGHVVCVNVVHAGFHAAMRAARYDLRSSMKNGLPVSALPSPEDNR